MKQQLSTRTRLRPGQTMHFHAESGLVIVAAKGVIRLAISTTLPDEQRMRQTTALHEGEAHVMQESGWLAVSAQHFAEVVCVTKERWFGPLWRRCVGIAARHWRRRRSLAA